MYPSWIENTRLVFACFCAHSHSIIFTLIAASDQNCCKSSLQLASTMLKGCYIIHKGRESFGEMGDNKFYVSNEGGKETGDIESVGVDGMNCWCMVVSCFVMLSLLSFVYFFDYVVGDIVEEQEIMPKTIIIGCNDDKDGSDNDDYSEAANCEVGTAAAASLPP